jgi:hypothetical protein
LTGLVYIRRVRRVQLFEFEDLDWWPQALRNYMTEVLSHLLITNRIYAPIVPRLAAAIRRSGSRRILDFCSGSGGPSLATLDAVNAELEQPVEFLLSDKFPNIARLEAVSAGHPQCKFVSESVDVLDPRGSFGQFDAFRTMFTALHHFRPTEVATILADAVASRAGIALFEFTERAISQVAASMSVSPLLTLGVTPKLRPVTLGRVFWTYLVPIVPLTFAWDGLVSALRSYGPDELEAIVRTVAGADSFDWDIGRTPLPERGLPFRITYLIGTPWRC